MLSRSQAFNLVAADAVTAPKGGAITYKRGPAKVGDCLR